MNNLVIEQSQSSVENVNNTIIEKLYQFAKISNVENENNNFPISLSGNILSSHAYEDAVLYLRQKFPNLIINVQDNNYYIRFADSEVERVLVESSLCSDGVGFSIADANLATQIPQDLFKENETIETFNELNRFGSVIIGKNAFQDCHGLQEINLSTVTQIKENGFGGCEALNQEISIPNLTSIQGKAFRYCTSIQRVINLGDTITSLPEQCFFNCTSLTEINVPDGVTTFGTGCFQNCSNLIRINKPSSLTSISSYCFQNSSNLTYFDLSNITSIGPSAFHGCSNFIGNSIEDPTIRIPNISGDLGWSIFAYTNIVTISDLGNITSMNNRNSDRGPFFECKNLTTANIPSSVTVLGKSSFFNCTSLSNINIVWENIITLWRQAFDNHPDWNFIINLANCTALGFGALSKGGNGGDGVTFIKQIYIPKLQYGDDASSYRNFYTSRGIFKGIKTDLLYLRDIEAFHPGDFCNTDITCLVINNITPPEWRNSYDKQDSEVTNDEWRKHRVLSSSTIANIYVPDSAVSTYQSDSNWSTVYDKIKPLSQLTKVATEADLQSGQIALIEAYM